MKTNLSLAQPYAIAFVWGMVLGLEEGLLDPNHPARLEWARYQQDRDQTTFDLFLTTPFRSLDVRRAQGADPVLATAPFRVCAQGSVEHGADHGQGAFQEGYDHGRARARRPFCWTAAPTWWKEAYSSPAGKKLHPSVPMPSSFEHHFPTLEKALEQASGNGQLWSAPLQGIRESLVGNTRDFGALQAAFTPLNAALAHCAKLAAACGTPPPGHKALWIVQDASNAARPVKAWSGTSAILAHALERMAVGTPNTRGIPTSMRLWKAWPEAAEDGHEARSLAP